GCPALGRGPARWRRGNAEDCKSLHAGSIPARASTSCASKRLRGWALAVKGRSSAALAQLVEHIIRNDGVTCSSHVSGTTPLRGGRISCRVEPPLTIGS